MDYTEYKREVIFEHDDLKFKIEMVSLTEETGKGTVKFLTEFLVRQEFGNFIIKGNYGKNYLKITPIIGDGNELPSIPLEIDSTDTETINDLAEAWFFHVLNKILEEEEFFTALVKAGTMCIMGAFE